VQRPRRYQTEEEESKEVKAIYLCGGKGKRNQMEKRRER
jgi:hypothetical protein